MSLNEGIQGIQGGRDRREGEFLALHLLLAFGLAFALSF
jgi:hypothetical protein